MIIATAGHVDHGKTSLVKALSGTDTDRLPEEKKRGLTIDIGFAYFRLNEDQTDCSKQVALIDVPGHEKFVRNMIAGVGLVDIALLVIAADDGPMPQTLEHLAILKLMDVKLVVPVVSKIDLVEPARVDQVEELTRAILAKAEIAATEIFSLSAMDRPAVQKLKDSLRDCIRSQPVRPVRGRFRMAIDRCFTLDGSGTVVTGTVASGRVEKNESVMLHADNPAHGKSARVRGLHAQNTEAPAAVAGQRCALNLTGDVTKADMQRGGWLVEESVAAQTVVVDVVLTPAVFFNRDGSEPSHKTSGAVLKHWTPAHLHMGTADIPCRIALLDCTEVSEGGFALARLMCERRFTAVHGDRFVLRDQSARRTIAGGSVLDSMPPARGRSRPERLQQLQALNADKKQDVLENLLDLNVYGTEIEAFSRQCNLLPDEIDELLSGSELRVIRAGLQRWCLRETQSRDLQEKILAALLAWHDEKPDRPGVDLASIKRAVSRHLDRDVLEYHLQRLIEADLVVRTASVFRHASHRISMSVSDSRVWDKIAAELKKAELTPLRITELSEVIDRSVEETHQFLYQCVTHGKVYKVTDNRYFLPQTLRDLAAIAETLAADDNLTVAEFRNNSGVGRNLVVELLEYFDRCRFTQRIGNKRRVLKPATEVFQ